MVVFSDWSFVSFELVYSFDKIIHMGLRFMGLGYVVCQLGFEIETSNVNCFGVGILVQLDMLPPQ